MDDVRRKAIHAILDLAIQLLGGVIPWLGTLLGLPLVGWIASLGLSYLTGLLADLIHWKLRFMEIDAERQGQADLVKAEVAKLVEMKKDPNATAEQKIRQMEAAREAVRRLTDR